MIGDGEDLRRRLYRPGAQDDDVRAYLAVADRAAPPPEAASPAPERRGRARPLLVVGVVAVLLAGVLGVRSLQTPRAASGPAPLPTRSVTDATAARFVAGLRAGDDAGLGRWWGPGDPYLEDHGTGNGTVLLPVAASGGGGRLTVLLVLATDGTAAWSVAHLVIHDDRTIHLETDASASGALRAGVPTVGRFTYSAGHHPLRLFVTASTRERWGVAVVFTD